MISPRIDTVSAGKEHVVDAEREQELIDIMERLAGGDGTAAFTLLERFDAELRRAVRSEAGRRGARLSTDDLDGLVLDVVMALVPLAPSWRPGGAPPWVWARRRVSRAVDVHVGQWADSFGDVVDHERAVAAGASAGDLTDVSTVDLVADVAARDDRIALLFEGVRHVASERDVSVFFDVIVEKAAGNRAPAAVVGRLHGMAPATVRQQHRRVSSRLRRLVASDPRFAPLADLAVVA